MDTLKALLDRLLAATFWRFVFFWKKRTGWLDLNQVVEVTGTIAAVDKSIEGLFNDGDVCFDLVLDPGQDWLITGFGGRLTQHNGLTALHCEIVPWMRERFGWRRLEIGQRVRVRGRWGFDGVHLGWPEWLEALAAIVRHQPNVREGWFEIHPVEELEFI